MNNKNNSHQKIVKESWQRCWDYGLNPDIKPELQKLENADMRVLLEFHRNFIQTAEHAVLPYYDNILNNSPCLILLTDSRGQILNSWGEKRFLSGSDQEWFVSGTSWLEAENGTNAIGTALTTGEAVQIQRDEHFLKRHRYMIGSAAPIFGASNELLGVLDISSDAYMPQAHTLGMVRLMSQSIENRLIFEKYCKKNYLMTLNTHSDNLESQWSGLIVINDDERIIACNRRAEYLLSHQLLGLDVKDVFGENLKSLEYQSKKSSFMLRVLNKYCMHVKIDTPVKKEFVDSTIHSPFMSNKAKTKDITFDTFEFGDKKIQRCIAQTRKVIEKNIPILVYGETGVGKEVFVKALHEASSRRTAPLMALNCAAMPANLVESELFGYVRGAFTGADSKGYVGLIRQADKGVLFLDELGDMPLSAQARLLRVLQERKVTPLGSTKSYPVDIKLISATNCNLKGLVEDGLFRKDLFYRVNGLNVEIPSLREREDKRALFQHIVQCKAQNIKQARLPPNIMLLFLKHPWPGNIRQFISVLDVALAIADGEAIEDWHLMSDFYDDINDSVEESALSLTLDRSILEDQSVNNTEGLSEEGLAGTNAEKIPNNILQAQKNCESPDDVQTKILSITLQTYKKCNSNKSKTARLLNISRNTLYKRLRELKLM